MLKKVDDVLMSCDVAPSGPLISQIIARNSRIKNIILVSGSGVSYLVLLSHGRLEHER
jgi:hypothetical protein